jgi:two-component system chemotaxis response regulator CheY
MAWKGKTVLVVDDMEQACAHMTELYTEVGMKVVATAANGLIALQMIDKYNPDFVSLDIIMPVMDGIECYREIQRYNVRSGKKAANTDIKCLIISCLAGEPQVVSRYQDEIPGFAFIQKYPTAKLLSERLAELYGQDAIATVSQISKKEDSLLTDDILKKTA